MNEIKEYTEKLFEDIKHKDENAKQKVYVLMDNDMGAIIDVYHTLGAAFIRKKDMLVVDNTKDLYIEECEIIGA